MNKDIRFSNTKKLLALIDGPNGVMVTVERERGCCEVRLWDDATQLYATGGSDWQSSYLTLAIFEHAQRMLQQWVDYMVGLANDPDLPHCKFDDSVVYALDELSFDVAAAQAHHESFQQLALFE